MVKSSLELFLLDRLQYVLAARGFPADEVDAALGAREPEALDDPRQAWVFTDEFTSAVGWMNDQPPGTHFYFLFDRWSFNYETRQ